MVVLAATVTSGALPQPGSPRQPWNCESAAGRRLSLTTTPAGNEAWHGPVTPSAAMVQSMPAGWEVTRPGPLPPGTIEIVPLSPAEAAGVQPASRTGTVPGASSATSTVQSAGAAKPSTCTLNAPFP